MKAEFDDQDDNIILNEYLYHLNNIWMIQVLHINYLLLSHLKILEIRTQVHFLSGKELISFLVPNLEH